MNLSFKKVKTYFTFFMILALLICVYKPFGVIAAPVAALSFLPMPMDDSTGEIKVYVRLRMVAPPEDIEFDGVNRLDFSVMYDSDIFDLKIDEAGDFFFVADGVNASMDSFVSEINDGASFSVIYEPELGQLMMPVGTFGYFILVARNVQGLFHSNDMYPLRFIDGSIYYRIENAELGEIIRIRDIIGIPCMVGGFTPDPPLNVPSDMLAELSAGDAAWRGLHLPPFISPSEIIMHIGSNRVVSDGITSLMDVAPFIDVYSDLTFVPVRFLAEEIGFDIEWVVDYNLVIATLGEHVIHITLGEQIALVNGVEVELDAPAVTVNWRTMVPLRFMAESVGYSVIWDGYSRSITLQNN